MNSQANIKNDAINLQSDTLTDLLVADEQAVETKAGTLLGGRGNDVLVGFRDGSVAHQGKFASPG